MTYVFSARLSQTELTPPSPFHVPYVKPPEHSKTLEWLKLRHLIDESTDCSLNEKLIAIFALFGGIRLHLKWLLSSPSSSYPNKQQLQSLIELLQDNESTPKNIEMTPMSQKTEDSENIAIDPIPFNTNTEPEPQRFTIQTISHDMTCYLCSFLRFKDIHFLQITCTDLAYVCLNEMKKTNVSLMFANALIGKQNIIHLGSERQFLHNYRVYRHDVLRTALNKWTNQYDIPCSKAMFCPLRVNFTGTAHRPISSSLQRFVRADSLTYSNFILFDTRNHFYRLNGSDSSHPIILKYFDIEMQKLYIMGTVIVSYPSTWLQLNHLIANEVIVNNMNLEYVQRLQLMLQKMNPLHGTGGKHPDTRNILFFRELSDVPHRCVEVGLVERQCVFQNVKGGDIVIFQVNPTHRYFGTSTSSYVCPQNSDYKTDNFDDIRFVLHHTGNGDRVDNNGVYLKKGLPVCDYSYMKLKNKYSYVVSNVWNSNLSVSNAWFDLEKQYESRGMNLFVIVPFFCRYIQQFRKVRLMYRHPNKWDAILSSILRINKERKKVIASKYHEPTLECEINANSSYGQIRKRIGFIYGIDYRHIEIWIPRSVVHVDKFEYTSSFRGMHSDSMVSFFKTKHSNFRLPIQWEVCAYSTLKYDQIVASALDNCNPDLSHVSDFDARSKPLLAIYRVMLVPPDAGDKKQSVDVIYEVGFQVNLFIQHVLSTIYDQSILCNEIGNIFGVQKEAWAKDMNVIDNEFVLLTDDGERCLFGYDRFSFPTESNVMDIERNTFYLQRMENEDAFNIRFMKPSELNQDETTMVFKFWKYVNHQYEVCGTILRVKVAAKDNLKEIMEKKLNHVATDCKVYLKAIKNAEYLGSLIEKKNYPYFYPFTILLQDNKACLNVLYN
eukprot:29223_1